MNRITRWMSPLIILALLAGMIACSGKNRIRIGFSGCLTGRLSDLGVSARDACILAVEEINMLGGVRGRKVELLIRDDGNDPKFAKEADLDLIQAGVTAIIGHMTSSMSLAALPIANQYQTPMISPTSTSNQLNGIDDYFFRVTTPDKIQSDILAVYAYQELGLRSVVCIYDLANRDFTEDWFYNFKTKFAELGGETVGQATFRSDQDFSYLAVLGEVLVHPSDSVLIIAGALNTGMFAQQIRKLGVDIQILSSGWAGTLQLIQHGGSAIEGVIFPQVFNGECVLPEYIDFSQKYRARFNKEPNFAAVCGYEAIQLLFAALSDAPKGASLKVALLNRGAFKGLQGDIAIDRYGDAARSQFIVTVHQGRFKTVKVLSHS